MSRTNFIKSGDVFTIVELKYYATLLVIILICSSHLCGSNAHIFVLNGSILSELFTIYYTSETEARPTIKIIRFWKKNVLTPKVPQVAVINIGHRRKMSKENTKKMNALPITDGNNTIVFTSKLGSEFSLEG